MLSDRSWLNSRRVSIIARGKNLRIFYSSSRLLSYERCVCFYISCKFFKFRCRRTYPLFSLVCRDFFNKKKHHAFESFLIITVDTTTTNTSTGTCSYPRRCSRRFQKSTLTADVARSNCFGRSSGGVWGSRRFVALIFGFLNIFIHADGACRWPCLFFFFSLLSSYSFSKTHWELSWTAWFDGLFFDWLLDDDWWLIVLCRVWGGNITKFTSRNRIFCSSSKSRGTLISRNQLL